MFESVSLEELSDAITRHCEALGRELSNQRDRSAFQARRSHLEALHAAEADLSCAASGSLPDLAGSNLTA